MNVQPKAYDIVFGRLWTTVGKPVITSNQAMTWDGRRLADLNGRIAGYARLLRGV